MHGKEGVGQDSLLVDVAPVVYILNERVFCDAKMVGIVHSLLEEGTLFIGEGSGNHDLFRVEEHGDWRDGS